MKKNNYLDVHGLTLLQAKKAIENAVNLSYETGQSVLNVNHGFNQGNKIKTWCLKSSKSLKHVLKVESGENEGISKIYIELKIF